MKPSIPIDGESDCVAKVAAKFSKGLGHRVDHVKQSEEARVNKYQELGIPEHRAKLLSKLEVETSKGGNQINGDVERVTGKRPQDLDAWIQENLTVWQ